MVVKKSLIPISSGIYKRKKKYLSGILHISLTSKDETIDLISLSLTAFFVPNKMQFLQY